MPTIETLADWNARLSQCGCCPMPSCPEPTKECETNWISYNPAYAEVYELDTFEIKLWKTANWECYNSQSETFPTGTANFRGFDRIASPCGSLLPAGYDPANFAGQAEGCTDDFQYVDGSGSNPWTELVFAADILADSAQYLTFPPICATNYNSCFSRLTAYAVIGGTVTKSRFRWKVPDEHTGSYFKITWDILNEPTGWNTTTLLRTYYAEDETFVWMGGTDRYSSWIEIPVPSIRGERRIVNIRYECYRSTDYGNKPQVTGEAVTLPDT